TGGTRKALPSARGKRVCASHRAVAMTTAMTNPREGLYRLQEKTIREQHQALAGQVDVVCRAFGRTPRNKGEAVAGLHEMLSLAKAHFRYENVLMKITGFSGRPDHERDHAGLIYGIRGFIGILAGECVPVSLAPGEHLKNWPLYHEQDMTARFWTS
ncbi:MAG: hypothetical protein J2P49_11205, partial [Methylocapsa sp.]|nr:hypothetical protein [Methylocapsa sp.]